MWRVTFAINEYCLADSRMRRTATSRESNGGDTLFVRRLRSCSSYCRKSVQRSKVQAHDELEILFATNPI